jgi:hypothetical protein
VAALVDDPNGGPTVYALEKISPFRAWKYDAGTWVLQAGKTHPFRGDGSAEDFMVAACYGLGVFWALEGTNGQARSRIWKPDY